MPNWLSGNMQCSTPLLFQHKKQTTTKIFCGNKSPIPTFFSLKRNQGGGGCNLYSPLFFPKKKQKKSFSKPITNIPLFSRTISPDLSTAWMEGEGGGITQIPSLLMLDQVLSSVLVGARGVLFLLPSSYPQLLST